MEDRDLLAAIGKVVVDSAALEYAVAVLVAVVEGHRDHACEDHALETVKKGPGEARRQLKQLADAHRDRPELMALWRDVQAVIGDRHVLAHSIALDEVESGGQGALVIWDPKRGAETTITTSQVLSHAQDIRIAYRRVAAVIASETGG